MDNARYKWWILTAMSLCGGLIMLDETVVGVALPTIRADLGLSHLSAHWVVSGYMLVFACAAAVCGRIGDLYGFKRLLLFGAALFGLSSLVCGLAGSAPVLLAARAAQGLGAAAIFPATVAMVMIAFPEHQRGMAMGTLAAIGTVFLALGPLFGGALTEMVSWRWIFWANIPIVLITVMIVLRVWSEDAAPKKREELDMIGALTLVATLCLLVFAIMQAPAFGWTNPVILAALASALALLGIFIRVETRQSAPLLNVTLFAKKSFAACSLILFTGQFTKITLVVFGAMYFQDVLGMSAMSAGLALLFAVAAFPVLSIPVGHLADKFGARRLVLIGLALASVGMVWIAVASASQTFAFLVPGMSMWGLGMPLVYAPVLRAMANAVPKSQQGQVGGIGVTFRLLGGVLGAAAGSTLLLGSGGYETIFGTTAALMIVALVVGWLGISNQKPATT